MDCVMSFLSFLIFPLFVAKINKLGLLEQHLGVRADAFGQPDVTADNGSGADNRFAAQDGGIGVDDDVIFNGRMTLGVAQFFRGIAGQGKCAEGHALVNAHAICRFR